MNVTESVKSVMTYISCEHIKLQDLYNLSSLELALPKDVFDSLVTLDNICNHIILERSNDKTIINSIWRDKRWISLFKRVKHEVRFSEHKFSVFACKFNKVEYYFFEFKGSKKGKRFIYTV